MKIDLEVLASTDIKRKKPWPRIIWIGEEQESLLLLDSTGKRISVLYVPSGKTKRRLPKVSPIADQVLQFSQTQNGRFLLGLLQSGEIFVWYKDKDVVKTVPGLEKIVPNFTSEKCHIAASGDCSHIFLAVGHSVFYLWVMEKGESVVRDKNIALKGSWHKISVPNGMDLPTDEAAECTMSSVFYESRVLGHCCQCSVIYNKVAVLSIATLVLKFPDPLESFGQNLPIFSAEWSLLEYPFQQMHPEYEAISTPGAYVSSYCGNGQVLAVAANQRSPSQTAMLFVSPLTDTVLVGGMRGCGIADVNKMGRQYWVTDLSWTSDNLFVACILNNGSVCLIPRLGEPIVIQTEGYSVNMGPSHFLPLHPAIFVSDNQGSVEPSAAEQDPMQQQFSLATHPSLPIILFSDGFLVTVVQLPVEMTSVTLMRGLVIESAKHLKKLYTQESLDMTVADSYKLSKGQKGSRHPQAEQKKPLRQYEFELAEISLNATHESEVSIIETTNKFGFDQFGAIGNLDSGKIVFGEPEMISIDPNATFSGLEASESLLKYLEASMSSLTLAWKLAASYSDIWTSEVDNITKQAVHNLSKIFSVVLDCPAVETIIPILTPRQSSAIQNPRVYNIIVAYRNVLQLLRFDTFNQHLIPAALRLVHKTIILMLTSQELENTDPKLKTLFGCYSLLKHAETSLNRVYVWVPSHSEAGTPTGDGSPRRFEPAVMTKLEKQTSGSASNTDGVHLDQKGQLPGKRLAATWKLLYKHVIDYQSQVSKKGDSQEELSHLEKLMFSIQQTLQETDTEITPRRASAKVSTVWLRHVFPFELMSESDSFMTTGEDQVTGSSVEPKTSPSLSPSSSTLKGAQSSSTIQINSYSSSQKENSTSSTVGNLSPNSAGQSQNSTLKIAAYSSSSKGESTSTDDVKYGIFNKIRAVVSKRSNGQSDSDPSPRTGTGSTIQVGSFSSSGNSKPSSSSTFSLFNEKRSILNIAFFSSSSKENSSSASRTHSTESSDKNSTMPVIMLDIFENGEGDIDEMDHLERVDADMPKSEGFEVLDITREFEVSQVRESASEKSESVEMKAKGKKLNMYCDKLSVDGEHTLAVNAWKDQLREVKKDNPKIAKMLHSVLYTYLLKDNLSDAVDFIDSIVLQARVDSAVSTQELPTFGDGNYPPLMTLVTHRSQDSEEEELVPCIKNKSIRQTVQTMARFMAAYFSNETMFIFPPHSAQALPSVHMSSVPTKSRIIPKYHEDITNVITRENLSGMWTTERTVEYLLLSGLICETAWFAYKMGDWKTAFLLSVAHTGHREIAQHLYQKPKKHLQLPHSLVPYMILQEKLTVLIKSNTADRTTAGSSKDVKRYFIPINQETNIPQLTRTLEDIMTAGIICDVEVAPWLLSNLTEKLKSVVSNLPSLVPQDFYLPAPPLFCPQPGEIEMGLDQPDVQYEKELRMEMSSIIQLILVSLNSAHLSLPVARWYIQELFKIQERAAQFKATTEGPCLELPEILQQYKIVRSDIVDIKDDPNVQSVMSSFRDICTILWLLHVRDELSLHLRKRGKQLSNDTKDGKESPTSTLGQEYVQECFKILKWAVHMLSFTSYVADDGCIRKVILSLILELPATEDTADILAEHFYAAENYDAEVQEKLERLLSVWQSVEILPEDDGKSARVEESEEMKKSSTENDDEDEDDGSVRKSVTFYQASPRAKTLSVYYHKQCEVVQKVLKKRRKCFGQYDELVFNSDVDNDNTLPSAMSSAPPGIYVGSRPFETKQSFLEFLDRFYAICFTKVVQKESEGGKSRTHAILMPFSSIIRETKLDSFISKNAETYQKKHSSVVLASPRAKFIRSQSESHVNDSYSPSSPQKRSLFRSNSSGDVQQSRSPTGMSRFDSDGSLLVRNSPGRNRPPMSSSRKPNMTGMASRFFQSEEVLYRDPAESQEAHWILDVNFGQRYLALQQLLDYLHDWGSKTHSLGLHGKSDKDLGMKPTMRIEVPTQLVVLGLWLLEHKYSSSKMRQLGKAAEQTVEGSIEAEIAENQLTNAKARALATVEELTEHDSFTQVSNIPRSRSHSPKGQRSRSHSPGGDLVMSKSAGFNVSKDKTLDSFQTFTTSQEETEQMKSAYKKVLDGGDDSSSLEVSSLEPDDYGDELKKSLSAIESEGVGRSRSPKRRRSPRRLHASPDGRNNSALNNTLQFAASPERGNNSYQAPQTSTPVKGGSPSRRQKRPEDVQADISRISLPPSGGIHGNTAPPGGQPQYYRGGLLGGNPSHTTPPAGEDIFSQQVAGNPQNMAGMDLAQQLQHIVRGELRRMMEVQHHSMMAMMGALDGQELPAVAWQQGNSANQRQAHPSSRSMSPPRGGHPGVLNEYQPKSPRGKKSMRGVLNELKNLQIEDENQHRHKKSKSPSGTLRQGKENFVDSPLRMSALDRQENIEVYRISREDGDPNNVNFVPKFLRVPAERDDSGVRFPHIPFQAWSSREGLGQKQDIPDMPLLHVERTVPASVFPEGQRSHSLPKYLPQHGYFQPPPTGMGQAPAMPTPSRQLDSPDSGIGIPLLRIPMDNEPVRRQPRFGELLPPDVVIETAKERQEKEKLREKYLREYHKLQAENSEATEKQRFGENLLHLSLKSEGSEEEQSLGRKKKVHSPHKSPRKSPRKTPRSVSEQLSARKEKSVRKSPGRPKTPESVRRAKTSDEGEEIESSERQPSKMEDSGEEAESEDEDATEAESVEEEEELDDGYAIRPGEFEAYLALEKQLAKTKDTNARIQLKTALRLQQQRMKENWKRPRRPKVDFATNTAEMMEAGTDADFADMEADNIRTSEKATSITKDTGVDPIHEAVIEYNKSRQPNMLPPDIYMGLRFSEAGHQPGSDVTGQPQGSRGRNYLNVVDLDASAILKDLKERPESEEPQLDVSVPATQQHIRNRIAMEERERSDLEPPVTERPTRADALTVRLFDTKYQGQERVSIAVMPREGMPDSKYAVMQRLRDMNTQLAAIDRMSNNMEKEFKNTRLAIHTLDQMTEAMEPPTREDIEMEDQYVPEKLERSTRTSRSGSPGDGRTLTPQPSAKSPTLSARATARSTARSTTRSKKSTVGDVRQMSTELAKVSGLSGISDIIGDMVAKGDINLDDVGLTKKEADHLVQRGAIRHEEVSQARISLDEIKKMASAAKHGGYDKDELHTWMAGKRQRQMEEYKRQVEELREKETRPFRPKDENLDVSFTTKERNALAEARKDSRKANARAFMTQRLDEAQSLLGNILTDKPELPKELPARPTPKRKPSVDRSPVRGRDAIKPKTFKKDTTPISVRKPQGILKNRDASLPAVPDYPQYEDEPYMDGYDSYDLQESWIDESLPRYEPPTPQTAPRQIMVQPTKEPRRVEVSPVRTPGKKVPGVVPKLKLGLDDVEEEPRLQQTAETTGELSEYYRAVEAMDVYDSQERSKEVARQLSEKEAEPTPQKTYKAKSYKDLVKVQRPEVTRKKANKFGLNYVGRLQSVSQSETSRTSARTQPTQREMEMIQGSKRLPMKKPTETTPRRVKTYTERLQEMKTKEKYSTPVAPRSQYGSSIASPSVRSTRPTTRSMKPKHKPMTYVEQLKKINEGHHKPRMGATTIIQKPMVKSHKPPHKPKTYAEQLQELQPTKTIQGPPSKRMHRPAPSRQRPYRDPYAALAPEDFDRLETDSVVSGWSMGDDVRQILYDDVEGSIAVGQSASYAPSEQISDYFNDVMGDSYTASVDIDDLVQIADAGSVSSGSMMSFIDWDQVDDLIADVK